MPDAPKPVEPGDTIEVPPHAYSFGDKTLRMEVTAVGPPFVHHGRAWWQEVHGHELCSAGRHPNERVATVRVDAVKRVPAQRPRT
jgi:hypothetical protein